MLQTTTTSIYKSKKKQTRTKNRKVNLGNLIWTKKLAKKENRNCFCCRYLNKCSEKKNWKILSAKRNIFVILGSPYLAWWLACNQKNGRNEMIFWWVHFGSLLSGAVF